MDATDFPEKGEWIDLSFLRVYSGDNKELMKKFLQSFLERTPAMMATIDEQWAAKDFHSLTRTMHSLKPQLSYVGITALSGVVNFIEESARSGRETELITGKLQEMKTILDKAYKELQDQLNTL